MTSLPPAPQSAKQSLSYSERAASQAGILIALDRQERGENELSAVEEIQAQYGIPVASIIKLEDLIEHLETSAEHGDFLPAVDRIQISATALIN